MAARSTVRDPLAKAVLAVEALEAEGFTVEAVLETIRRRREEPASRAREIADTYIDIVIEIAVSTEKARFAAIAAGART